MMTRALTTTPNSEDMPKKSSSLKQGAVYFHSRKRPTKHPFPMLSDITKIEHAKRSCDENQETEKVENHLRDRLPPKCSSSQHPSRRHPGGEEEERDVPVHQVKINVVLKPSTTSMRLPA